eukprot:CCRYP_018063-RA/>CCRYP_018063-RA protein AED:0.26 eAED:0.28 QI:0/0/0/1/1/1/2/0/354
MTELMATLEFVRAYIDDLLCITKGTLEDHLAKLELVLSRLQDANLKVNARKSNFCAIETEYLGYILSREGIKPQPKKVQSILALTPPKMSKTSVDFLAWSNTIEIFGHGAANACPTHKPRRRKPWKWTEEHQKAFDDVKATIAKDVSLAYPDYSKGFEIYTDGSKRQLGAVITQNNRPIAFFSRKLSVCQQKYSVTEIELLAIVETLKEFKGMLWGQPIVVYTDHKNLMQDALGLTCDRVYRWRLLLEEYGPEIVYIKGIHNTVADAISRLDFGPTKDAKENWMTFTKCWCYYTMQSEEDPSPAQHSDLMNFVFANRSEENAIYPLTVRRLPQLNKRIKCWTNSACWRHTNLSW